jgi:hypothetical protein
MLPEIHVGFSLSAMWLDSLYFFFFFFVVLGLNSVSVLAMKVLHRGAMPPALFALVLLR